MLSSMMERILSCFFIICMFCNSLCSGKFREKISNGPCDLDQFRCVNDVCIGKAQFCNGRNDCGDNSDESYCSTRNCPVMYPFKCASTGRCIPASWRCDGKTYDCGLSRDNRGDDEYNCDYEKSLTYKVTLARNKASDWIRNHAHNDTSTNRWGTRVQKTAVALFLSDPRFASSSNLTRREMAYELSIQLLSKFMLKKLKEVSVADLASYINALLVTCVDPRQFHSIDLVHELRSRVNAQNYSNPYDLLTLCNAGDTITKDDVDKLTNAFWTAHREIWTETQAIVVMALVCAGNQPGSSFSLESLKDLTEALKQKQYKNGTVEDLQTTALVMQALFASESEEDESFDEEKAFMQILRQQKPDGSFGSIVDTYYTLPILYMKSLVNISSKHCTPHFKDEDAALHDLINRPGSKIRVRYSLWIGNEIDVERTLKLRAAANISFYGVMEMARDIDSQFRFQYVVKNRKPYITALSGIQDDPETGRFWFPYGFNDSKPYPLALGPADVVLKDNDHVAMWYRSGSWIE